METWAFAISKEGLALSPAFFWCLSLPEFDALKLHFELKQRRWAQERADFRNAHFTTDGVPWVAEDFLDAGNRTERVQEHAMSVREVDKLNASIAAMNEASNPEAMGVPVWAIQAEENAQKRKAETNGRATR